MLEIIWNNILAFPHEIWNDFIDFFKAFYNPNNSILENIFYNEIVWVILALWLYIKTGGKGGIYIIITLPLLWLIFHIVIVYLGIEIFFLLLITISICYYYRRGLNNIFDIIFTMIKYIVLVVLVSYIILAVFGAPMFLIAIMVSAIFLVISAIKNYIKKWRNNNI